jgi:putative addiction module CopG family antidote
MESLISPLIDINSQGKPMNISIEVTGSLLAYLDSKVKKGLYKSRSEVIREAIREMLRQDLMRDMAAKGVTPEELMNMRNEVAHEILAKKYKKLI